MKMISGRHMIAAGAILAAALSFPAGAYLQTPKAAATGDVQGGVEAWQRGDFASAVGRWRPLADRGDADAQFNMGQAYRMGRGVPADAKIAQSWYQKAAAQGHELAQANLGLLLYEAGKRAEALPWIRKAAGRGDPRAQYVLGVELTNGEIVPRDFPRAYALMTRAASKGLPPAAKSLEQMEKFIPAADRQKGVALAGQMQDAPALASVVAAPRGRVAGSVPRVAPPAASPPVAASAAAAKPVKPVPAPVAVAAAAGGQWRAQLGAYGSPAAAQAQWSALAKRVGALGGLQPSYEKAGAMTRLRVGPLANRAAADRVCAAAKAAGQACFPVAP